MIDLDSRQSSPNGEGFTGWPSLAVATMFIVSQEGILARGVAPLWFGEYSVVQTVKMELSGGAASENVLVWTGKTS
ncbi:hypothetical protein OAG56_03900 [Mariniblastus sp.]|nr:hypothetical protein [Mariniblastus sp.]MDB4756492.1 hypothetical protein [Mariniblastus sp.]